jgi:DNA-binding transcriptional LysR family regulator
MTEWNANVRLPPLDTLPAFEAAARLMSFTRAAEEMALSQSAISKQIALLESVLDVKLFERKGRALNLTVAGKRLYTVADTALATLRSVVADLRSGSDAAVTVATTPAFASFWLIPRLGGFRHLHPGVDIRISADTRLVDLDRGRLDAAIRHLADKTAPSHSIRLSGGTVLAVCSPKLLSKSGPVLTRPADLEHHTLINYDDDEKLRPWLSWPVWLEAAGLAELRPAGSIVFNRYESALPARVKVVVASLMQPAAVYRLPSSGPRRPSRVRG